MSCSYSLETLSKHKNHHSSKMERLSLVFIGHLNGPSEKYPQRLTRLSYSPHQIFSSKTSSNPGLTIHLVFSAYLGPGLQGDPIQLSGHKIEVSQVHKGFHLQKICSHHQPWVDQHISILRIDAYEWFRYPTLTHLPRFCYMIDISPASGSVSLIAYAEFILMSVESKLCN